MAKLAENAQIVLSVLRMGTYICKLDHLRLWNDKGLIDHSDSCFIGNLQGIAFKLSFISTL